LRVEGGVRRMHAVSGDFIDAAVQAGNLTYEGERGASYLPAL